MFEGNTPPSQGVHIDSIGIEPYQLIAGKDTTICMGHPYELGPSCDVPLESGTFHWTSIPTDPTLSGQEHLSNPVVSPDTVTMYILAVYDSLNTCDILPDTITINDKGCCLPLTGDLIYGDTTLSTASTVTITSDFAVNGTLVLTGGGTFVFNGSDVSLGTDAEIIVVSGTALEITNQSHLHACNYMWNEIFVENGAEVTVNGRSLIEDAETALYIEDGANYVLSKANFNKNYRHVFIGEPTTAPVYPGNRIDSCFFLCQTTASIGSTPVYTNLLHPHTADSTLHGVWAYDARHLRLGAKSFENYFSNCRFGASAWLVDTVDIQSNTFEDVSYVGISAAECGANGDDIYIYDNTINRTPDGIYCYDNPFAITKIYNNRIDYNGMASPLTVMTGITVIEIAPGDISDPNHVSVYRNSIKNAPCGIHTMNLFGLPSGGTGTVYIGQDTVSVHQPSSTGTAHAGILAENLTLGLIIDNTVKRNNNDVNWWETAIRIGSGQANQLMCNYTHHIGNGLWFDNDQRPLTALAKNVMENNGTGLLLNNGKIGQQGSSGTPHDNEWLGTWTGTNYSTHCYGSGSDGTLSEFFVQNSYPYLPTNNANTTFAPFPVTVTTTSGSWIAGCAFSAPSFKTGENELRGLSDALTIIATSSEDVETDRARGMHWASRYGLYKALMMDEELRHADNELLSFYDQNHVGNIGKLHLAVSDFQRLRNTASAGLTTSVEEHLSAIQGLSTEERPEQRLVEVLRILYANIEDMRAMGNMEESRLREIAQMCPIDDGFGVYIARATLLKLDTLPRMYTSECESVPMPENWKNDADQIIGERPFRVYPNPNSGQVTVQYQLAEGEAGDVRLYSSLGQLVFDQRLDNSSNHILLFFNDISIGLYTIVVTVNGHSRLSEKLSIMR